MSNRPERLNTDQMVRRFYRAWWKRPFWLLGGVVVALVAGRIALTPLLINHFRQQLDQRTGNGAVTFRDLDVYLFPPTFVFRDVDVRLGGGAGESLQVPRVEIHAPSWRSLAQPAPVLRVRLERPALRLVSGSQDLERIARALPAARIEVASVSGGSVGNRSAPDGRPVIERITGELEGLASGTEVGKAKWQFWGDGHLLGLDPIHVVVGGDLAGALRASLSGRQADAHAGTAGPGPAFTFEGDAGGSAGRVRGSMRIRWSSDEVPTGLSQDRARTLDERWPGTELQLGEVKPGLAAGSGGALDVVLDGAAPSVPPVDRAAQAVGLVVGMVRVSNRALAMPVNGLAALGEPVAAPANAEEAAASYDSH